MKIWKFTLLLLLSAPVLLFAQPDNRADKRMDEIMAQKVAYITTKLDLTPFEAQQFWPVYNDYTSKKESIHRDRYGKKDQSSMRNPEKMTDEEAGLLIDEMVANQEKMASIEKEYSERFRKILPVKKVLKLYEAEMDFKRVLLDRIKDRHSDRRKP